MMSIKFNLFSLVAALLILDGVANGAIIYVDGDDTYLAANDGAFFDGTDMITPSAFSTPELIKNQGDETLTSDPRVLSSIPYIEDAGKKYFQFIYDQQETANTGGQPDRERVIITAISIYVGPDTTFANASLVWELDTNNQVYVNDQNRAGGPFSGTDTPQSAGGDMRLNVPFSVFPSGTTTDQYLFFRVTQTDSDNGGDEWVLNGEGMTLPVGTTVPIPEPNTWMLMLVGMIFLTVFRLASFKSDFGSL